ncbi:hypothetical protein QEZ54_16880 [Catellatospora sp. KI3]|uniref:hypothetical protein n=1 Tax=Catellatospora sp. KI3 TaxID=3041620 RepID=UPI002482745E|nr:hypothetical protein [Catellatospora sp. KI3]MDI1462650.1 hypothetical protein [Catellatospora sp. KI3]
MPGTRSPAQDVARAEAARDELDELGLKYFMDVRATARRMLEHLDRGSRTAFAAAVARRLFAESALPEQEHPDVLFWRPVLDAVDDGLAGGLDATGRVAEGLGRFYLSPAYTVRPHDDPMNRDDNRIMAACYTAECYLHGSMEFATWAGWRGFDTAAIHAASDPMWPRRRPPEITPYAWELAHPSVQAELDQQLADLEQLADGDRSSER